MNVHGSLLPKYRGAAPIQWAIIQGETVSGVTTMLTDVGLDTGPMLLKAETPIGPDETAGELFERLAVLGAQLLQKTIAGLEAGTLTPIPQDDAQATHCTMIKKEDGRIDFHKPAAQIHNLVRGTNPWPVAWCLLEETPIKIWETRKTSRTADKEQCPGACVIADPKEGLFVQTGDGLLQITSLQFPGGKRMDAKAALLGRPLAGKQLV